MAWLQPNLSGMLTQMLQHLKADAIDMPAERHTSPRKARAAKPSPAPASPAREIRPEKVARGKELVRDTNYPPPRVVRAVARILARCWAQGKSGATSAKTRKT